MALNHVLYEPLLNNIFRIYMFENYTIIPIYYAFHFSSFDDFFCIGQCIIIAVKNGIYFLSITDYQLHRFI